MTDATDSDPAAANLDSSATPDQKIQQAVDDATAALRRNSAELKREKTEIKDRLDALTREHKTLVESLGGEAGVAQLVNLQKQAEHDAVLKMLAEGKREEAISKATEGMRLQHAKDLAARDQQIDGLTRDLAAARQRAEAYVIEVELGAAADEALVKPQYKSMIAAHVRSAVHIDPTDQDGRRVVVGVRTGDVIEPEMGPRGKHMTLAEKIAALRETMPDLFTPLAAGTGASGSGSAARRVEVNPWRRETFNLTQQSQIARSDPDRARRLAVEAGVKADL